MENSKKKIINKLKEATVDKASMQAKWNNKLDAAKDVVSKSLPGESQEDITNIAAKLATESAEVGFNPVVQYDSDRNGEEPFLFDGDKWQYVNAIYPDGKRDIGVYRYGHDMVYDYKWFMDNIVGRGKNTTSSQIGEVNKEVMDKFIKQYGEEKGKQVYYATANKQDRDEKTFKVSENGDDVASRGIEYGSQEPEVGADKYEEYRKLMQQMAAEDNEESGALPNKDNPYHKDNRGKSRFSHKGLEEADDAVAPEQTNDPVKLKADVAKLMSKLDMSTIAPYLAKIDNPTEQAEVIAQFAERIGVPKNKLGSVISQLRTVAEAKITKDKLIETVNSTQVENKVNSNRKIIKTIKVKNIK